MPTRRRQARILALQALYEGDTTGHDPHQALERMLVETDTVQESADFARELVAGAVEQRAQLDEVIARVAPAWPLEQMATIDRNILRLAILEILLNNRTPVKAAINEAVELAKTFGSDNSAKFVNGVLGSVSAMATR
ncbi:MAG: transcription antitermination factor NusB [Dehalococcoidia bacterium]|jgi:N utilization substance protein B